MIKGMILSGEFGKLLMRKKKGVDLEVGELLIGEVPGGKVLLQVVHLLYGSQLSGQNLELISGLELEEGGDYEFMDEEMRNYELAYLKSLLVINGEGAKTCKGLPPVFSVLRSVEEGDLKFLTKPQHSLFLGYLRSGREKISCPIYLDGGQVLSHHILIAATTGRGKSNLTSCVLWDSVDKGYCGMLVLDPHDEYYGRNKIGLKDHPQKEKVVYYTPKNVPPGGKSLKVNIRQLKPKHFDGVVFWTDPQKEALNAYYKHEKEHWIDAIIMEKPIKNFHEGTLGVVKRKISGLLGLRGNTPSGNSIFDFEAGMRTIGDIVYELEQGKTVIVDTSHFSGAVELLVGSMITTEIFSRYKRYKMQGELPGKPVISVILEEAPRVLGKEVLERGSNIFSTIAREGRKFKVGLTAITQLPSLIPRDILANMNTKLILGIEMKNERHALIESAAQDLSDAERTIAALDKGEMIVTSNFARFATPVKVPLFKEYVSEGTGSASKVGVVKKGFPGMKL